MFKKVSCILRLQEDISNSKLSQNSFELQQREAYISDLPQPWQAGGGGGLDTSAFTSSNTAALCLPSTSSRPPPRKLESDLEMYQNLFADKVIAEKELRDKQYEYDIKARPCTALPCSNNAAPGRKS